MTGRLLAIIFLMLAISIYAEDIKDKKVYSCEYMKTPPFGVTAWSQSDIVKTGKNKENRFVPYNSKAAKGLILDATTMREIYEDQSTKDRETSFYMFYNDLGWYIYIQCDEPNIEEFVENNKDVSLEVFFCPGLKDVPYYQMIIRQLKHDVSFFDWAMTNRFYRSLKDRVTVESMPIKSGFGTFIFIPWDVVYNFVPLNGESWRFSFMRWGPSMTWGGQVHDTGNFGLVKFAKPSAEVKTAIEQNIIRYAKAKFKRDSAAAKKHWNDDKMGDLQFFNTVLNPVIEKAASENPENLANIGDWMEFNYKTAELRTDFLTRKILPTKEAKPIDNDFFTSYVVPAMSPEKRLPDSLPSDAEKSSQLKIIAARDEYEPASFLLAPKANIAKLTMKASDLKGAKGIIPAKNIDIKIVKVWYQGGGTAWYSYFGDSNRRELVPELLLNDENLVKVDKDKQENYLRVGDKYTWISYPSDKAEKSFNYLTEPVADSPDLMPAELIKSENKQFWVTLKVPQKAQAGTYQGKISLVADGKPAGDMELIVKVLPFTLPMPKTYYNINNDYLVTIYGTGIYELGYRMELDQKVIDKLQMDIFKNALKHNIFNCRSDLTLAYKKDRKEAIDQLKHEVAMIKKAGFVMKPFLSRGWSYPAEGEKSKDDPEYKERIDDLADTLKKTVGHSDIYVTSWDEATEERVKIMRDYSEYTASKGLKMWVTTHQGRHFDLAGYLIDYANHGGWPKRENADRWHSIGSKIASYAGPHTGPENPDVFRRWEGMARYKANYDGSFNYKLFSALHPSLYKKWKQNVWNDFTGGTFRGFNLVYPTSQGPIDTIAWEGFREGIDDVRYATELKTLAAKAIAGTDHKAAQTAKKALIWLELKNAETADLNEVRLEMIEYILKLRQALGMK